MRRTMFAASAVGFLAAGVAWAQAVDNGLSQMPANQNPQKPAIADRNAQPTEPAAGANSFTQDQAKSRISDKGFTDVSGLTKDSDGVWRGTAMRDGTKVSVAVDFQGNVIAR